MQTEIAEITSEAELRDLLGTPSGNATLKERTSLHPHDRNWIAHSPFLMIATAGADGTCDVSPKGDPPGSVLILDDTTLAIAERPGNKRADGYRNILANPHVGLIFLIPGREQTLRINGRARLIRDAPFFDRLVVKGHRPQLVVLVEIEQIFFHCPKAFKRSRLWQPEEWPDISDLPSLPCLVKDTTRTEMTLAEVEEYYGPSYEKRLYGYG